MMILIKSVLGRLAGQAGLWRRATGALAARQGDCQDVAGHPHLHPKGMRVWRRLGVARSGSGHLGKPRSGAGRQPA